ncbi:hypothetical protein M2280_005866 [Prescottella agglutinans]|uniref:Uncharacterized protein n=1 Tax=Prescottella agglutinans TaxID=1644129 RepID=A0ABT6MK64_9NOCA|nr:hypothetical protein [Prescottella agglutinans]
MAGHENGHEDGHEDGQRRGDLTRLMNLVGDAVAVEAGRLIGHDVAAHLLGLMFGLFLGTAQHAARSVLVDQRHACCSAPLGRVKHRVPGHETVVAAPIRERSLSLLQEVPCPLSMFRLRFRT